jgi:signal transduction histidine kinase
MLNRDHPERPTGTRGHRAAGSPRPVPVPAGTVAAASGAEHGEASAGLTQIRSIIERLPEPILLTDAAEQVQLTNPSADALFAERPVRSRQDLLSRFEALPNEIGAHVNGHPQAETAPPVDPEVDDRVAVRLRHEPARRFSIESFPLDRRDTTRSEARGSVYVLREGSPDADVRQEADAFLAIMSHELRTPITTIYAGSSVLAHGGQLSPPASHMLALDISAEAARLYDLVEDLIAIARLERRALDPLEEPVLLQRVADITARVVAGRAPDVVFLRDGAADPPPVRADQTYVEHAARDLALAAARFGGPTRPVTIRVDHDTRSAEVSFRVLDRGPELSQGDRARAFDLPTDSDAGRLSSRGVGPFVARHLIEAMDGRVWAQNRPDGGLELGFALPVDGG